MQTFRCSFIVLMTVVLITALTTSPRVRAAGRDELESLMLRYDRDADGAAKNELAARIDSIAHQKYATVSRLYWHVSLDAARAAARRQGRPILHLRMLGRLDEDLSCANSRLFRATLYANQDVSRFLRERFVLYWSSERPVARVTIDYGDGRRLERTTAGNSAHYVLDEDGNVLDVLPGLYAPAAFRRELENSLTLAAHVRGASDSERARLVAAYQQAALSAERDWERLARTPGVRGMSQLMTQQRRDTPLAAAQLNTATKMAAEVRDLRVFVKEIAPDELPRDQIGMWAAAGQNLVQRLQRSSGGVLDEASRALVVRLHNAAPPELRAGAGDLDSMIARLEQTILADTALNQLRLRPQIAREIVRRGGRVDFQTLNAWIYAKVFHTPREDAWLGLLQRDVFTGLPGDGVVLGQALKSTRRAARTAASAR